MIASRKGWGSYFCFLHPIQDWFILHKNCRIITMVVKHTWINASKCYIGAFWGSMDKPSAVFSCKLS